MIISKKLKKSKVNVFTAAAFNIIIIATHHWKNKNDKTFDMISFSCKKEFKVHIIKINNIRKIWTILKTQYEQSDLTTLYLIIKELI